VTASPISTTDGVAVKEAITGGSTAGSTGVEHDAIRTATSVAHARNLRGDVGGDAK
jgi:hypothetical protein